MGLETLLTRACINRWHTHTWFAGVSLVGTSLLVPDADAAAFIARNWGDALRAQLPGLDIKHAPAARPASTPSYLNAKGRRWYQEQTPKQSDLL
jgi:hypothetical protein